ncbi:MAG: hypothetical protein L6R39_006757 [Caloplaca ligustica]|nr:MAG: hypothetical protein L6R39_006757 [Caloplaca ligustica]
MACVKTAIPIVSAEVAIKATQKRVAVAADEVVGVDEAIVTTDTIGDIQSIINLSRKVPKESLMQYSSDHVKQADLSWGAPSGDAEWNDEKAGEAIAHAEEAAEGWGTDPQPAPVATGSWNPEAEASAAPEIDAADTTADVAVPAGVPDPVEPEPEDNSRSYADYLAEQAEKKLKLGAAPLEARKPNEGSKQDKKWAQAKPLSKDEEEAEYIAGKGDKAKKEKQRKEKNVVDVDFRYAEPARGGERGRGRGRGGDRGRGGGRGRGEFRGRGDGFRGDSFRGGRGGRDGRDGGSVNVSDENAFPSLGGS